LGQGSRFSPGYHAARKPAELTLDHTATLLCAPAVILARIKVVANLTEMATKR